MELYVELSPINSYLTWDIGLGQDPLFWEDSWDGLPSPDNVNIPINIKNTLSALWVKYVSDYKK